MHILEVNRGLGLGGSETLLALRLAHRAENEPDGVVREFLNTAPDLDYYEASIRGSVSKLNKTPSRSVLRGIVHCWRAAKDVPTGSAVVVHAPAASWGFKLSRHRRRFTLVDVAHATEYRRPYRVIGRLLDPRADLCIAVSTQAAEAATTAHHRRKSVVLGGVDREAMRGWIQSHPDAPREFRSEIAAHGTLIVNVGNLLELKNQRLLIRAMAEPGLHDATLAIIGEGPERPRLERLIRDLRLSDRVHLLGRRPEAWQWIAVSDLVVHPSHREGLPVVLMEAAALGVPTVAAPFGGASDVAAHAPDLTITSANTGRELANSIQAALAEPADEWADRGAKPTHFDIGRYSDEFYGEIYRAASWMSYSSNHST